MTKKRRLIKNLKVYSFSLVILILFFTISVLLGPIKSALSQEEVAEYIGLAVEGGFSVSGPQIIFGTSDFKGTLYNSTADLTVGDNLRVDGYLWRNFGAVKINDDLSVSGSINAGSWAGDQIEDIYISALASASQGDIIYYNGQSWVKLMAGTLGQYLQTRGTGSNPLWASASSLDESDPVFNESAASNIVTSNITNWNAAYSWGDHSSEGYLIGASSATDNAITRFDGTTGEIFQNSGVIIDNSNNISGINTLTASNLAGTLTTAAQGNITSLGKLTSLEVNELKSYAASQLGDGGTTNYVNFATDGEINLHGTARVTVDNYITASGVKAPGAKPATFIEHGICGAWQFADAGAGNEESISGTLKLPTQMDKTVAPILKIGWSANGVSPGNCEWQLEYVYRSPNEATDAAAQETLTATGTASATSNGLMITVFTGMDLPSGTDQAMFYKITRLSDGGNDTIVDTVELRGLLFTHTRNTLGTAL